MKDQQPPHQPFPEDDEDDTPPPPAAYTMMEPRFREIYFRFYRETCRASALDRKTKELVAIGASLTARCQGCIEGHIRKALRHGASREEISETIAIAMGVSAAAVVDLTDIAAESMQLRLFEGPAAARSSET